MANDPTSNLENIIRRSEDEIHQRQSASKTKKRSSIWAFRHFRLSLAICIWLAVIVFVALRFDSLVDVVVAPADEQIEMDLNDLLTSTGRSLRNFQLSTGALPYALPNPAIRGLVKFQRLNDRQFVLSASINDITVQYDSREAYPRRINPTE